MRPLRVTHAVVKGGARSLLTSRGHLPRDLSQDTPGLKIRYRPELGCLEFKREQWDGTVVVPREAFESFELDETVELEAPKSK